MTVLNALKWSFFGELAAKAIQPIVFIILARLLTPEDFGVMTAALMVIGFSQIFWEAGMGKALIQRQADIEEAANAAFWINMCLGMLISGLLYQFSESIALFFFQDERVTAVLQVMTLQVLFGASASVQTALLQKEMGFKKLFWVRLVTVSLPGIASIPIAWDGGGYWALVVGNLTGQAMQIVILWKVSHWKPVLSFSKRIATELTRFAFWVSATGFLAWSLVWVDSIIVAKYFGIKDLGIYKTGSQFASLLFVIIFTPLVPVFYSYFSKNQQNSGHIKLVASDLTVIATTICIPASLFVFFFSGQIEGVFFGEKWVGISHVIGILSIREGLAWVTFINGEYYRALNKPHYEALMMIFTLFLYVSVYMYSISFGIEIFSWSRVGAVVVTMLAHLLLFAYLGVVQFGGIIKKICVLLLVFCFVEFCVSILVNNFIDNQLIQLLFGFFVSVMFFLTYILAIENKVFISLYRMHVERMSL